MDEMGLHSRIDYGKSFHLTENRELSSKIANICTGMPLYKNEKQFHCMVAKI
jgi:hypothetical protein